MVSSFRRRDSDVVLTDHFCRGHNELDLPGITSPLMYEKIAARKSVPQLYEEKLLVRQIDLSDHLIRADFPSPIIYRQKRFSLPQISPASGVIIKRIWNLNWLRSPQAVHRSRLRILLCWKNSGREWYGHVVKMLCMTLLRVFRWMYSRRLGGLV